MNKTYRCSPASDGVNTGRGSSLIAKTWMHFPWIGGDDLRLKLDRLSTWGGSTSNAPSKYAMWEFPLDGKNYAKAIVLLRTSGWMAER